MPGCEQIRRRPFQGALLVTEDLQGKSGVQLRVVHTALLEPPVLIMLDEVMIGVARKGQRAETQGVHRRQLEQPQARLCRRQVWQVEGDQIVAQKEGRPVGEIVELRQFRRRTTAGIPLPGIGAHRAKGTNTFAFPAYLQIERKAARPGGWFLPGCRRGGFRPGIEQSMGRRTGSGLRNPENSVLATQTVSPSSRKGPMISGFYPKLLQHHP